MSFNNPKIQAYQPDPNSSQVRTGKQGNTGDKFHKGEFATVLSYQPDRYTATVKTERGRTISGVPRLRNAPGDVSALSPGSQVLVSYDYGPPIIMGVLAMPAGNNDGSASYTASETEGFGGQGLNQSTIQSGNFRNATEPRDLMPGDRVQMGTDGNMLGLLEGGVSVLKSSTLSQIRTHMINDLVEIFSRNFRHITDMGELTVKNDDGRVNLSFRGGTDQRNETGPDEENWTIKLDLGAEGDIFNFELTTPNGQTLFRFYVDASGKVELYGVNGVDLLSGSRDGGKHAEEHTGDSHRSVEGDRVSTTQGNENRTVKGDNDETITGNKTVTSGNDTKVQTLRDLALGAGRNAFLNVQGGDGSNALTFDIESGNWKTTIGGASSPDSNFNLETFAGDISFTSTVGGDISLDTRLGNILSNSQQVKLSTALPSSVILGGDTLSSHLVKWEELQAHLSALYSALDSHQHLHTGSASAGSTPVVGVSGRPVVPIGSPLTSNFVTFKSQKAGVSS